MSKLVLLCLFKSRPLSNESFNEMLCNLLEIQTPNEIATNASTSRNQLISSLGHVLFKNVF